MELWLKITLGVVGYLIASTLLWYYWGRKDDAVYEQKRKKCRHQLDAPEGTTVKCYHYVFRTLFMILFMGVLILAFFLADPFTWFSKTKEDREASEQKAAIEKQERLIMKRIKKEEKAIKNKQRLEKK